MAKIIAIVNQKGGVGKTTTCVNLAAAVKAAGKRVLLCDFDPQANATSGMGVDKTTSNGVYDALINGAETAQLIVTTPYGDVLPSSKALAGAGVEMINMEDRQFLLKAALRQVADSYDFIFIDCPPSLELLTLNALCAANSLLVPVQGEYYALEGLSDLMNTVRIVRRSMNPGLDIEGVLLTMFDGRTNLSIQVAQELKRFFAGKVYSTVIPRNVRLSEAPSHGKPITAYDKTCRGADAYTALAAHHCTPAWATRAAPGSGKTFAGPNIPLGVGLKYKVKNRINLGCEFSFRKLFGDGLDVTDDSNAFLDDPYHMKGSFLKNKDWYSFLLFTVTWDFGPRCRTCNNAKNIDNIQ